MSNNGLSTDEKVNLLFKNYMNFTSTLDSKEFFEETALSNNANIFSDNILSSLPPSTPSYSAINNATTLSSLLVNAGLDTVSIDTTWFGDKTDQGGSFGVDSNNSVVRMEKIKLDYVANAGSAFICKDKNGVNILQNIIPSNYAASGYSISLHYYNGSELKPVGWLTTRTELAGAGFIGQSVNFGGALFDAKNGVITFYDVNGDPTTVFQNLSFYLTASKYVGPKGVTASSKLDVSGDASFNSNVHTEGNLNVVGDTTIKSTLDVSGATTLSSNLTTVGDASFNSGLSIDGNLNVDSSATISGKLIAENDLSLNGNLVVDGTTSLNDVLTVVGDASFNSGLSVDGHLNVDQTATITGKFIAENDASLNQSLTVNGATIINNTIAASGDVSFNSNLNVGGNIIVDTNANIDGDLLVKGSGTIDNDLLVRRNLTVDGSINFLGEFIQKDTVIQVTEQMDLSNDGTGPALIVRQHGAQPIASFYDDQTLSMLIKDGGDVSFNENIVVEKNILTNQNLTVQGTAVLNSTLTTAGDVSFGAGLSVDGNLNVDSNSILSGSVGIGTNSTPVKVTINSTDSIKIPVGTNAQRPTATGSAQYGYIRYNTDISSYEGFGAGNVWGSLGGVKDVDQDTYISAENSAGADNDQLKFFTAGTKKMMIDTNGNVGIGTTNPGAKLDVAGNIKISSGGQISIISGQTYEYFTGTASSTTVFQGSNNTQLRANNGDIAFFANTTGYNSEKMRIKSDGNVGIGTTIPGANLHIKDSNGDAVLKIGSNSESTDSKILLGTPHYYGDSAYKVGIIAEGMGSYSRAKLHFCLDNNTFNAAPTYDASISNSRMTILPSGEVGIGTTNPSEALDVNGSIRIREGNNLYIGNSITDSLRFQHTSTGHNYIDYNTSEGIYFRTTTLNGTTTDVNNVMILDGNGNVGIGTNPSATSNGSSGIPHPRVDRPTLEIRGDLFMNDFYKTNVNNVVHGARLFFDQAFSNESNHDLKIDLYSKTGHYGFGVQGSTTTYYAATRHTFYYEQNGSKIKVMTTNGPNVGIGTDNPQYTLDTRNTGTIRGGSIDLYSNSQRVGTTSNTLALFGTNESGGIGFYTTNTTNVGDAKMYIRNSGNVGIGSQSPASKLDVNGSIRGAYNTDTTSYFGRAAIGLPSRENWATFSHINKNDGNNFSMSVNQYGYLVLNHSTGQNMIFAENNQVKMTLTGGNFGIGTSPTAKLHVVGTTKITGDASFNSGLSVDGNLNVDTNAVIMGDSSFNGTLDVEGNGVFNNNLLAKQNATVGSNLNVGGTALIYGNSTLEKDLHVKGHLNVDGSINFLGEFIQKDTVIQVTEQMDLSNDGTGPALIVRQHGAQPIASFYDDQTLSMLIKDGGDVSFNENIVVEKNILTNQNLTVQGTAVLNSTLTTVGDVSFGAGLSVDGNLNVDQTATITGKLIAQNDASLNQSLTVDGATTLNSRLTTTGDASFNAGLSVDGALNVDQTATITGKFIAQDDASLNQSLTVDGSTTIKNTLTTTGDASFNAGLSVDGALNVDQTATITGKFIAQNDASLNQSLTVDGATTLNSTLTTTGDASFNAGLSVDGHMNVDQTATITGKFIAQDDASLNQTLTVDGATVLKNTLTATGDASFNAGLSVDGNLNVDQTATITGKFIAQNDASLNQALTVDGITTLNNNVLVKGNVVPLDDITYDLGSSDKRFRDLFLSGSSISIGTETINVNNNTVETNAIKTNSHLEVGGDASLNQSLTVDGATIINNTLTTTGDVSFNAGLSVDGNLNVDTNATIDGDLLVKSSGTIDNDLHIKRHLTVDGSINFLGNFIQKDTIINVTEQMDLSNDGTGPALIVRQHGAQPIASFYDDQTLSMLIKDGGDVSFNENIVVEKNILTNQNLTVQGTTLLNSTLTTVGDASFGAGLSVDGNLNVDQTATITGKFIAQNDASLNQSLTVDGSTTINNTLTTTGDASFNAGLSVDGNLNVDQSATITGKFIAQNDASLNQTLTVDGATIINNTLTATGDASFNAGLSVDGHMNVDQTATITGKFIAQNDASLNQALRVDGTTVINNTLTTTGDASFNAGLSVDGNLNVDSNSVLSGSIGIGTNSAPVKVTINSTDAIKIPVGTDAQRPTATGSNQYGYIRYNTDLSSYEGFGAGDAWGSLGGVKDVDQDTYITAENAAGIDNDELKFYTAGSQRMIIDSTGDTSFNANVNVVGNLNVDQAATITGKLTAQNDASFNQALNVDGATTLNSTLGVTGDVSLNAGLSVDGNMNVDQTATITGKFIAQNDASLNQALNVDGTTVLNSTLTVVNDVSLNAGLSVDGTLTVDTNAVIMGDSSFNGTLDVEGNGVFNNSLLAKQNATVDNNLSVGGTALIYGNSTLEKDLHVKGHLNVDGSINFLGEFIQKDTIIQVTEQMDLSNDGTGPALIVRQHGTGSGYHIAEFYDDTSVSTVFKDGGDVSFNKSILIGENISINGTSTLKNDLTLNGDLINNSNTVTNAQLSYVSGVTSSIQTQIDSKQAILTGATSGLVSTDLTANKALLSDGSGKVAASTVTNTELGYVSGVTSAIQTQIDSKHDTIDSNNRLNATLIGANGNVSNTEFGYLSNVTSDIQTQIDDSMKHKITFAVTVASKTANHPYVGTGSGSGYFLNGQESPVVQFKAGKTYRFNQDNASNGSHPIQFYLDAGKTTQYTTGVTSSGTAGSSGAYIEIQVTDATPSKLYYQCANHGYMGNYGAVEIAIENLTNNEIAHLNGVTSSIQDQITSNRTYVDNSLNTNYYVRSYIDSSMNNIRDDVAANRTYVDNSLNTNYYVRSYIDSSMNNIRDDVAANRSYIDTSLNTNYHTKTFIDTSLNSNYVSKNGDGTVLIAGDLTVDGSINFTGDFIKTDTIIRVTEQMDLSNDGTGPALIVRQHGAQPIASFYDDASLSMVIKNGGDVSFNKSVAIGNNITIDGTTTIKGSIVNNTNTVTNDEFSRLSGVTSGIQTQIDNVNTSITNLTSGSGGTTNALNVGTTAQRPDPPSKGMIRFNTDISLAEIYTASDIWSGLPTYKTGQPPLLVNVSKNQQSSSVSVSWEKFPEIYKDAFTGQSYPIYLQTFVDISYTQLNGNNNTNGWKTIRIGNGNYHTNGSATTPLTSLSFTAASGLNSSNSTGYTLTFDNKPSTANLPVFTQNDTFDLRIYGVNNSGKPPIYIYILNVGLKTTGAPSAVAVTNFENFSKNQFRMDTTFDLDSTDPSITNGITITEYDISFTLVDSKSKETVSDNGVQDRDDYDGKNDIVLNGLKPGAKYAVNLRAKNALNSSIGPYGTMYTASNFTNNGNSSMFIDTSDLYSVSHNGMEVTLNGSTSINGHLNGTNSRQNRTLLSANNSNSYISLDGRSTFYINYGKQGTTLDATSGSLVTATFNIKNDDGTSNNTIQYTKTASANTASIGVGGSQYQFTSAGSYTDKGKTANYSQGFVYSSDFDCTNGNNNNAIFNTNFPASTTNYYLNYSIATQTENQNQRIDENDHTSTSRTTNNFYVDSYNSTPVVTFNNDPSITVTSSTKLFGIPSVTQVQLIANYTISNFATHYIPYSSDRHSRVTTISKNGYSFGTNDKTNVFQNNAYTMEYNKPSNFTNNSYDANTTSDFTVTVFYLDNSGTPTVETYIDNEKDVNDIGHIFRDDGNTYSGATSYFFNGSDTISSAITTNDANFETTYSSNISSTLLYFNNRFVSGGYSASYSGQEISPFSDWSTSSGGYAVDGPNYSSYSNTGVGGFKWIVLNVTNKKSGSNINVTNFNINGSHFSNHLSNFGSTFEAYISYNGMFGSMKASFNSGATLWYNNSQTNITQANNSGLFALNTTGYPNNVLVDSTFSGQIYLVVGLAQSAKSYFTFS